MGNYQKFRGDSENKLFYLLDGLVGGINTEFSDDASSDIDFESIINFNIDKLGTLTKRNGFGKIRGLASLLQRGDLDGYNPGTDLPWINNITEDYHNVEEDNDNLVYVKLLKNDNNCFRNLAAFDYYWEYQKQYGFQNNEFKLLMITTKVTNGVNVSSKAWYYHCRLPEIPEDLGDTSEIDYVVFNAYKCDLPVTFNWNKTLMNMDSIEYYDDIWFTNNDSALVRFDRSAEITSNEDLDAAFHYTGVVDGTRPNGEPIENEAYLPSLVEVTEASLGLNSLTTNPLYDTRRVDTLAESIQGAYLTTKDLGLLGQTLIVGEPVYLGIQYTGSAEFNITAKNGDTDLGVQFEVVEGISQGNTKFYQLTFSVVPDGEVEITIEKTDTNASEIVDPYRLYVKTGQLSSDVEVIETNNIGNCGMCMMSDNRVAYYREDTIFFSDVNRPNYLPFNSYLKLPLEPTDKITKICYFKGVYVVFTKESIYKLIGNWGNSSTFACEPVNTSLGCHAGHTVVPIEDTLYFASPRGLYALKSSTFIEGMQNLVELDIKVKKLTSDFTLYEDELSNPAMRFNGINEKAYALRYRDKYMLFFNSSYEKGDYAAKNNLDVLVYDYSLKSFTTYTFLEKPTFLFMVDNALQTFSTVLEDEIVNVDPLEILNYDMSNQSVAADTVEDSSNEGNDGIVRGDLVVNQESYALKDFDYIEANLSTQNLNFVEDLDLSLDMKLSENQMNKTIFDAVGEGIGDMVMPYSGVYRSEIVNGYEVVFRYDVNHTKSSGGSATTENTTIDFILTLNRTSTEVPSVVTGTVNLKDVFENIESNFLYWRLTEDGVTSVKEQFSNVTFSANFENALSVELLSDKLLLDIQGGVNETQKRDIKLNIGLTTHNYYDYYEKGSPISGTNYEQVDEVSWIRLGTPYSVVAYDGYARFTVTSPYVYHSGRLNGVAINPFNVTVAGKTMSFTMPERTANSGTYYATGNTTQYVDITYPDNVLAGNGAYTVTVASAYKINATLSGVKRVWLNTSFSLTLPNIKRINGDTTTEQTFEGTTSYNLEYIPPENDLHIKLIANPSDTPSDLEDIGKRLYFEITDYSGGFGVYCVPVDLTKRHIYTIVRHENIIELRCDGEYIGDVELPNSYLSDRLWRKFTFGTDIEVKETFLDWEFFGLDFGIFKYNSMGNVQITETEVQLVDKSANNNNAVVYGAEVIPYEGTFFVSSDGYIELPTLSYNFEMGFTLEANIEIRPNNKPYTLFDTAKSYGNANIKDRNAAISVDIDNGFISLSAMTQELIDINVTTKKALEFNKTYNIKFVCERVEDTNYTLSVYVDGELNNSVKYRNVTIISTERGSSFLGKSNNQNYDNFKGVLNSFKIEISSFDTQIYRPATVYEFDTSYSDFGKPIYYELQTKGINLKYPQHIKKLKHIFMKVKGGYKPNDVIFELHTDGYLVNDPKSYYCYVDETGKIVYDYTEIPNLTIDERVSVLGNMTLNNTRLGEGNYQTIKMVIPSKGKNFKIKIYGKNKDYISLESFGLVAKLGKVKQD